MLVILVGIPIVLSVNGVVLGLRLKGFVERVREIKSRSDLQAFQGVVKVQMYAALAVIGLMGLDAVVFAYGFFSDLLELSHILWPLIPSVLLFVVGKYFQNVEHAAQQMPVAEELRGERQKVVETWLNKPFPDW